MALDSELSTHPQITIRILVVPSSYDIVQSLMREGYFVRNRSRELALNVNVFFFTRQDG